jgi:heat shock protein HspQ
MDASPLDAVTARFTPGQLVRHLRFGYRGVIVDVDPAFCGSEQWYRRVARSCPPRDKPWYHVLVHGAEHRTYVAERHLTADDSGEPVRHPELDTCFRDFRDGRYRLHAGVN